MQFPYYLEWLRQFSLVPLRWLSHYQVHPLPRAENRPFLLCYYLCFPFRRTDPYLLQSSRLADRQSGQARSEEHMSELQSRGHLVCRLVLEKKKKKGRQQDETDLVV